MLFMRHNVEAWFSSLWLPLSGSVSIRIERAASGHNMLSVGSLGRFSLTFREKKRLIRAALAVLVFTGMVFCFTGGHSDVSNADNQITGNLPDSSSICADSEVTNDGPIYFVDVSGDNCHTVSEACSIESAARANPTMSVIWYSNTHRMEAAADDHVNRIQSNLKNCDLTAAIQNAYTNIRFYKIDMHKKLSTSPFEEIVASGSLNHSTWRATHLKNALSWVISEANGGIYLDSKIVTFRPLDCLRDSLVLVEDQISPDVIILKKKNPLSKFFMNYASHVYRPEEVTSIGGPSLSSTLKLFCFGKYLREGTFTCLEQFQATLLPSRSFFPVQYDKRHLLYQPGPQNLAKLINFDGAYGFKAYTPDSNQLLHGTSMYAQMMSKFCPVTFRKTQFAN